MHTVDGGLTGQLLKHLGGTSEPVTRLADGDVEDQLLDAQLPHGVGALVGLLGLCESIVSATAGTLPWRRRAYHCDCGC